MAASCRPAAATDRWRFADSAFSTRLRSPRTERATCRASSSSSAAPAPMSRRNVADGFAALPGDDAAPAAEAATRPAGPSRRGVGQRAAPLRAARRTRGGSVRLRCSANRARGTGRAARRAGNAPPRRPSRTAGRARARVAPGERPLAPAPVRSRAGGSAARRAPAGLRRAGQDPADSAFRSHGRAGSIAASSARSAATRSRSVATRSRPGITPTCTAAASAPTAAGRRLRARSPHQRRRQARRVVMMGVLRIDDIVERRAAGADPPTGGQRSRPAGRATVSAVGAANWLFASTTSTMPGRRVGLERLEMVGEVEASVSPSWVATLQA